MDLVELTVFGTDNIQDIKKGKISASLRSSETQLVTRSNVTNAQKYWN